MIIKDVINESQGGMSKRWLESQKQANPHVFVDKSGKPYTIANLTLFPIKQPLLPMEELVGEIEAVAKQLKIPFDEINAVNKQPVKQGAGMLVVMKDAKGGLHPFFKFFQRRNMDALGMFWQTNDFKKETGLTWQETRVVGKGTERKEEVIQRIDVKPINSVPVNTDLNIRQVPSQVIAKLTEANPDEAKLIGQLAQYALQGKGDLIPGLALIERDLRVDFGEVATPLALVSGALAGGQYDVVQSQLLSTIGVQWKGATKVFYPEALNEPLFDSILIWPNGEKLRISNKAKGSGGAASVVSIAEIFKKYPERFSPADKRLLSTKYKHLVTAIETISSAGASEGVLSLAQASGIITAQDAEIVYFYLKQKIAKGTRGLTPKLKKILTDKRVYAADTTKPDYAVCYHLTAAIAKLVVGFLNQDMALTTSFLKFMLERANLIQVNQFTKRQGDAVGWERFDVVWPPVFTGKIKFDSSNFQANKRPNGRISFKV